MDLAIPLFIAALFVGLGIISRRQFADGSDPDLIFVDAFRSDKSKWFFRNLIKHSKSTLYFVIAAGCVLIGAYNAFVRG